MIEDLLLELQEFTEIEAIVLGGSRASNACDPMSDYDIYIYASQPIPEEKRLLALGKYCARAEIGNAFWETEDNVFLKDGTSADLIYRSLSAFYSSLNNTLNYCQPSNGYTTCMWYNLLHSIVLYDPQGQYAALQRKYSMEYPPILRRNILRRSRDLLFGKMPNYTSQIKKAALRNDLPSLCHRSAAWMESCFDALFALNFLPHPGEKRMLSHALKHCSILPADFAELVEAYFQSLYTDTSKAMGILDQLTENIKAILPADL